MPNIRISIDLRKIDQSKCKSHANGAKYCEIFLMERSDQYGNDFMVTQDIPKADRDKGERGAILGNGKFAGNKGGQATARPETKRPAAPARDADLDPDDDIPF